MTPPSVHIDQIRVRFATFRDSSMVERAAFADALAGVLAEESVLLETCHRVELVSIDDAERPEPCVVGAHAVRRIFEVVAGFDSAVVAEEQLLGQVRDAYEAALAGGSTGPILNELFRRALRFGRRVRSHARPGTDRSLADGGTRWLLSRLNSAGASVAVAGTGEMGRRIALQIAEAGHQLTIVSRSGERADRLAGELVGSGHRTFVGALSRDLVANHAAIVLAVRVPEPLLTAADVTTPPPLAVLDVSTPAAVDTAAATVLGHRLMGIDHLGGMVDATPVLDPAVERRLRAELEQEVARFAAWIDGRRSSDAIAVLHGQAEAVRRRHLERLRRRGDLAPAQLDAVEAAAAAMVGELLHGPSVELRRSGDDADVVRRLFGLDR